MKKIYFILLLTIVIFSCKTGNKKFQKHESGLEYIIVEKKDENSRKLENGDIVILNMTYEKKDGTILFNSQMSGRKYLRNVIAPTHTGGSFEDGLAMLSEGDSAIFKINAENFLIYSEGFRKLPKDVKYDEDIIVNVRIVDVLDNDEYDAFVGERYHVNEKVEMEILKNYLNVTNIQIEPMESGLYYIEQLKGPGKQPQINNTVQVHYTVKTIDGKLIETTLDKTPISFTLGRGEVIPAWEEGILYMKEGGKARIIAPSKLAYGSEGKGTILPYSTLVFDVELIKVQ